jgi:hypothetical protein
VITAWTKEDIKKAREWYGEGMTYLEIGKRLNRSRNAIAGLCNRMKFERVGKPPVDKSKVARPLIMKEKKPRVRVVKPPKPVDTSLYTTKTLIELNNHDCRWPIGEDEFVFCARPVKEGRSYCPGHYALAYYPRRREEKHG